MHLCNIFVLAVLSVRSVSAFSSVVSTDVPITSNAPAEMSDVPRPTRVRRDLSTGVSVTTSVALVFAPANPTDAPLRTLKYKPAETRVITNGERLAQGLPPRKPTLRRVRGYGSHRRQAAAAQPSSTPCVLRGRIQVTGTEKGGFVSRMANPYGEYRLAQDPADALSVVLRRSCNPADDAPFEIEATNGLENLPLFGGFVGVASSSDDLIKGSRNYVYLSGTGSVPSGPAQNAPNGFTAATRYPRDVESFVWTSSLAAADGTLALTMGWVNTDGSAAQGPQLVYHAPEDAFALVGDAEAFSQAYGPSPSVAFTFVPDAAL
ncbi:hypothetical protein C2E23DRAFT_886928 [Lenzites betulinus]|nr:hypothetical protein C2E23DRAFT_886928 [Lenzites betulinus]